MGLTERIVTYLDICLYMLFFCLLRNGLLANRPACPLFGIFLWQKVNKLVLFFQVAIEETDER